MIQLKYIEQRLTDQGIQEELGISEGTYRRWRNEFIGLIAERLGWET